MTEVLRFSCPHCQTQLSAGPENAGKTAPCPACGLYLILPGQMVLNLEDRPAADPGIPQPVPLPGPPDSATLKPLLPAPLPPPGGPPAALNTVDSAPVPGEALVGRILPRPRNIQEPVMDEETPPKSLPLRVPEGSGSKPAPPHKTAPADPLPDSDDGAFAEHPESTPDEPRAGSSRRLLPKAAALILFLGAAVAGGYFWLNGGGGHPSGRSADKSFSASSGKAKTLEAGPASSQDPVSSPPPPGQGEENLGLLKESPAPGPGPGGESLMPENMVAKPLRDGRGTKPPPGHSATEPVSRASAPNTQAPSPSTPPSTPLGKARQALESFLAARDWKQRLQFALDADKLREPMAAHFRDHPDGPIPVEGISYLGDGPVPDTTRHYYGFRVRVRNFPADIPMAVEADGEVFLVDWDPFQEAYEQRLKAFFDKPGQGSGKFRVVLRRKHYFGPPVPGQDVTRRSFSVESPMRDESWFVWADVQSAAYQAKIAAKSRADWDTESFLVVELVWAGDEKTGYYVTLKDVVADNWQLR